MLETHAANHVVLDAAYREASKNSFYPLHSVRSPGPPVFRSQLARDLGCLLDVDETVTAWSCLAFGVHLNDRVHVVDFMVDHVDGTREFLDATEFFGDPEVTETLACMKRRHRFVTVAEMRSGNRLENAKDLLRYARQRTPLNDRVRLLAALDEAGAIAVGDTFGLFRETAPLAAISWMALHRFISMDLDDELIGPNTLIRRVEVSK